VVDRMALTDLHVPIVGAAMAGGPSTPALAAAVANAGGLGFLAAGMVSAEKLADALVQTRCLTSGAIGVNLFVPQPRRCNLATYRAFAAALSHEAEKYRVPLGEPRHDDDDWRRSLMLSVKCGRMLCRSLSGRQTKISAVDSPRQAS
jgi:nitronate monooxygenase